MAKPETWPDHQHHLDRRMTLARQWDDLVAEVRELPGFTDFLRPPSLESLLPAAADGPVVVINVSRWRCDALLVTTGGVDVVELGSLTYPEIINRIAAYLETVDRFQDVTLALTSASEQYRAGALDDEGMRGAVQTYELDMIDLEQRLSLVLEWCWEHVTEPVLTRLGFTAPPGGDRWPRLWWCPTGLLTLLPLHAAGRHETPGESVIERVVSSYTPTLRALLEARRPPPTAEEDSAVRDALLVVAMPQTPGQPALPNVAREVALLTGLDGLGSTVLQGPGATVDAVREALSGHRWVHFACHGDQNLDDPAQGGVLLTDGMLTVTDISARQYHSDLAYLSACKTATGGTTLPDEAITLAAALHYTGYRHVIATLWSIWDDTAPTVAESVYRSLADGAMLRPERSAVALHHAVRALRADRLGEPSVWMPYTHTGP
ncbi:CHAT domain-containing protein [Micromonospora sp. NPDC049891]|uniref:CHAT domain-containing protein n=1 Tax=Micromonospora sp. NPDC049891 TaxID=3155655 RepID=UPI00340325B0